MNKKLFLLGLLLILILGVSQVSAGDIDDNLTVSDDVSNIEFEYNDNLSVCGDTVNINVDDNLSPFILIPTP